jgi:hypothetical protein
MTPSLNKKIENNKIYLIISNRIIKTCLKATIFIKKTKHFKNKKINYIILNKIIFNKIFSVAINESIQLPTLLPIIYQSNQNITINENHNYTFHTNNQYIEALNYLNAQKIIINKDYLNYLNNLTDNELYKLSEKQINLQILKKKYKRKKLNTKILSLIFISNLYILNKYKNYTFYFKYKCDKRGRIYQSN